MVCKFSFDCVRCRSQPFVSLFIATFDIIMAISWYIVAYPDHGSCGTWQADCWSRKRRTASDWCFWETVHHDRWHGRRYGFIWSDGIRLREWGVVDLFCWFQASLKFLTDSKRRIQVAFWSRFAKSSLVMLVKNWTRISCFRELLALLLLLLEFTLFISFRSSDTLVCIWHFLLLSFSYHCTPAQRLFGSHREPFNFGSGPGPTRIRTQILSTESAELHAAVERIW